MSRTSAPAFGVTKSKTLQHDTNTTAKARSNIPVVDISKRVACVGELVINQQDSLLYYSNGFQWIPLAINDVTSNSISQHISVTDTSLLIETPKNIMLIACDSTGHGGDIHISAGHGGVSDGSIYHDVGGEHALTIDDKADIIINSGSVIVKSGSLQFEDSMCGIKCVVDHVTVDMDVDTQKLPDINTSGLSSIITINLQLPDVNTGGTTPSTSMLNGKIINNMIKANSLLNTTIVNCGTGVPYIWLDNLQDGVVYYNICSLKGDLTKLQLHIQIHL